MCVYGRRVWGGFVRSQPRVPAEVRKRPAAARAPALRPFALGSAASTRSRFFICTIFLFIFLFKNIYYISIRNILLHAVSLGPGVNLGLRPIRNHFEELWRLPYVLSYQYVQRNTRPSLFIVVSNRSSRLIASDHDRF